MKDLFYALSSGFVFVWTFVIYAYNKISLISYKLDLTELKRSERRDSYV